MFSGLTEGIDPCPGWRTVKNQEKTLPGRRIGISIAQPDL
jgi:hypothetical protein